MSDKIEIAQSLSIRDAGLDEYWLQDQIVANPACLGLGELEAIAKERHQSSGGRLDILLKDPEDDTMYEVEVMLGETNETHIIRTLEYWDNEKRRWPQRQHIAVLPSRHCFVHPTLNPGPTAPTLSASTCTMDSYSALWDAAFDRGLISFTGDGTVLASPQIGKSARNALGLANAPPLAGLRDGHKTN